MKIIYSEKEKLHRPEHEWSYGKLLPYAEKNTRAEIIKKGIIKDGMKNILMEANEYPLDYLKAVINPEMVDFVKSCEELEPKESVFPHVFPYRDFTPEFTEHPRINLKKAGYYCFDVGIEIDKDTFEAAKASTDVALTGAGLIINKQEKIVFSLCRPPGHHAGYSFFGGYCIFNNAAVAAHQLSMHYGPVAILDVDFHHGNGTQDIFYEQPNVLYVSLHGDPSQFYPFFSGFDDEKGEKLGRGTNINIPLPSGIGDYEYRENLKYAVKQIKKFHPQALVISIGFDTFEKDPIGEFKLTTAFYKEIALIAGEVGVPILAVLEGGYDIADLQKNGKSFIMGLKELE